MKELEVSGKTVEQAIQKALEKLGVSRDQIDVVIVSEGRVGILGLGAEEARIRVRMLVPGDTEESDLADVAKEVLEKLLEIMGISASVVQTDTDPITLNVRGDDLGILIGRHGDTLASLQYILRLIIAHYQKMRVFLTIDIEGYKQRRYKSLRELALNLAQRAKSTGQLMTLEPMPADERRVVHLALSVNPDVTTQSVGEGEVRKVVIQPRKR